MAYARYGRECHWYIFWEEIPDAPHLERTASEEPREAETLAIWHVDHRTQAPRFTYEEVRAMLRSGDFSRIPGYRETDRGLMTQCLFEFARDVDAERTARHERDAR